MSLIVLFQFFFCSAFILPSPGFNTWDQGLSLILRHELSSNGSRVTCAYDNWDPFKLITPLLLKKKFFFFFSRAREVQSSGTLISMLLAISRMLARYPLLGMWELGKYGSGKIAVICFRHSTKASLHTSTPLCKTKKKKKKSSMKWLCSVGRFKALQGKRKKKY